MVAEALWTAPERKRPEQEKGANPPPGSPRSARCLALAASERSTVFL